MITIIIFASSLSLTAILVLMKAVELKYGKRNLALYILSKLDGRSAQFIAALKFRSLQIIQSVRYILLVQTKEFLMELLARVEEKIMNEYRARQSAILMGHKELAQNGSASFYLRKITEHKDHGMKGKIEESL